MLPYFIFIIYSIVVRQSSNKLYFNNKKQINMQTGMQRALELIAECKRTKATFLDLGNLKLTEVPEEVKGLDWVERLNLGWKYEGEDG